MTSMFSGAFALLLLFWLSIQTGNMYAAALTVISAACGWFVNLLQDIDADAGWQVAMGAASVIAGAFALISIMAKLG